MMERVFPKFNPKSKLRITRQQAETAPNPHESSRPGRQIEACRYKSSLLEAWIQRAPWTASMGLKMIIRVENLVH